MITCNICGEKKPEENYNFCDKEKTRRRRVCKPCRTIQKKEWRNKPENRIKTLESFYKYRNKKRKENPEFRVVENMRSRISNYITRRNYTKKSKYFDVIGCDRNSLLNHLKDQFKEGMSFNNYGQWHVDHIIPLSSAKNIDELMKLCHYTNLQPLWAFDNIKKSNKLNYNTK